MINMELQRGTMLKGQTTALYELFSEQNNVQSAERAKDLALKLAQQEYAIAFCGHFSAGKSSMINQLVGENILPTSPIPTSANLVKIKSGEEYAKVYLKEGRPLKFPASYNYEKVKAYAKDGESIEAIEISYAKTTIPENTVIMDTPGIDSTDDAHRIATESALHLADMIFYVMDYNHVQAELNFLFTKELIEAGKQVFLIINMIDKHREEELSFTRFQESVRDSFASWGVHPERIFYTTLKEPAHPHNEFLALKQFINEKINKRYEALPESLFYSLKKLGEEHLHFIKAEYEGEVSKLKEKLAELPQEERNTLSETIQHISGQLNELKTVLKKKEDALHEEINHVLDNAYLMPFETRELAEQYLASRQPDFKVGFFFKKQKTEQERKARLARFYTDLTEKVTAQIDWHIKELLTKTIRENKMEDGELFSQAQSFNVSFDKEMLSHIVKPGAGLTGEYVLNYTNDVANAIKRKTKEQLTLFISAYLEEWKIKQAKEERKLIKELARLKSYASASEKLKKIEEEIMSVQIQMDQVLSGEIDLSAYEERFAMIAADDVEAEVIVEAEELEVIQEKAKPVKKKAERVQRVKQVIETELPPFIASLKYAARQVQAIPGFKNLSDELMEKAERLENQSFTVALFGAFSAGKSSFANALLGRKVLPVSPNPTTAAINKIMPVDERHPHGTVLVKLKTKETLMADVNHSLAAFALEADDIKSAVTKAKKVMNDGKERDGYEKLHLAFLNAFVRGIDNYEAKLGEIIETNLEEFTGFVANEEQSCFVEWIEVYYDCELTQKGITLVDTPGADSINARHTGVAFDYIKNSDAILFVTYYNHAFSKADREFLIQLGRVKDTFALDKMFFIVNAVDLANNEEELEAVLDYVEEQLITYGIREPHLFPLSSLEALQEKLAGNGESSSGMKDFEERFYAFIEQDLRGVAVSAAKMDWQRMIAQLHSYIDSAEEDEEAKAEKRELLKEEKKEMLTLIEKQNASILEQRLAQEIDELVYYINQRVFLRFNDFFKESFNPSLLKDDGRNLKKALDQALENFLNDFGFDFAQELRATSLRIEAFMQKLLAEKEESLVSLLQEINHGLAFSSYEMKQLDSPDFVTAFTALDRGRFKTALSHFKNPKTFFEKGGHKLMRDELEKELQEPAEMYLKEGSELLKNHYHALLDAEYEALSMHLSGQIKEFYEGALVSLSDEVPIAELRKIAERLERRES